MNNNDEDIIKIAEQIFEENLSWSEACKELNLAEKTLRKKIIELCEKNKDLLEAFINYKEAKNKHNNINIPAVIVQMVKEQISLSQMANKLEITKETLRALIKKEKNEILNEILKKHNELMKSKKNPDIIYIEDTNKMIDKYILQNPNFNNSIFLDKNSNDYEINCVKEQLNEIDEMKKNGMTEKQISEKKGWGPEKIRRLNLYLRKLELKSNKTENKFQNNKQENKIRDER